MVYSIIKWVRWIAAFGLSGIKALTASSRNEGATILLHSKRFGTLVCRRIVEDIEAVNTVMCFHAYQRIGPADRFGTVVDLGANIGVATRYFIAEYPGVPIVALEPDDRNCAVFEANLRHTEASTGVQLVRAAIGPTSGRGWLTNDSSARLDSLRVDFNSIEPETAETVGSVEVISLDDLIQNLVAPILLKVDIEGAEGALLETRERWQDCVGRMMVEFHDPQEELMWVRTLEKEGWAAEKHFDTWHFENQR